MSYGRLGGMTIDVLQSLPAGCISADCVCVCVCLLSLSLSPGQPVEATPVISTLSFENWAALSLNEHNCSQWFTLYLFNMTWKVLAFTIWHTKKTHITAHASPRHSTHGDITLISLQHMIQKPLSHNQLLNLSQNTPTPTSPPSPNTYTHSHPLFLHLF